MEELDEILLEYSEAQSNAYCFLHLQHNKYSFPLICALTCLVFSPDSLEFPWLEGEIFTNLVNMMGSVAATWSRFF